MKNSEKKGLNEKTEVAGLSQEEQAVQETMETAVRGLFGEKAELASYLERIKPYLAREKDGHIMGWEELIPLYESGQLFDDLRERFRAKEDDSEEIALEKEGDLMEAEEEITAAINQYYRLNRLEGWEEQCTAADKRINFDNLEPEQKRFISYKWFVLREFAQKRHEQQERDLAIKKTERAIDLAREKGDWRKVQLWNEKYKKQLAEYEEAALSSPEAFFYEASNRLLEAKNVFDGRGGIVETPYVKETLSLIDYQIKSGRHIFIHGELGSGKSELAKHYVRTRCAPAAIRRWDEENPRPADPEKIEVWEKEREEYLANLFYLIPGNKNIDIDIFFGGKSIQAKENKTPEEQAETIDAAIHRLRKEREEQGRQLEKEEEKDLRDAYKESFKSFVEVKPYLGLFYKAMKEGKPLILDEMNAIPHTALIALNDYLTLRPGDRVNPIISNLDPFVLKEGFSVIATGNWKPEDGKHYFGRQGLDAAFLSRFGIVGYDYLPNRTIGETVETDPQAKRREKAESELLDIMVAKLLDPTLGLWAPKNTLPKLRSLARSARILQNAYSEKKEGETEIEDPTEGGRAKLKDLLQENVLSIRHLLPLLEEWQKEGFGRSLDEVVMRDYIHRSSAARGKEKMALYQILQTQGLFQTDEGWPNGLTADGLQAVLEDRAKGGQRIASVMHGHDKLTGKPRSESVGEMPELVYTPPIEVIEELFGPLPERKEIRKRLFKIGENIKVADPELMRGLEAELEKLSEKIKRLKEGGFVLDEVDEETFRELEKIIEAQKESE
jgi:MoxR-like ATPase